MGAHLFSLGDAISEGDAGAHLLVPSSAHRRFNIGYYLAAIPYYRVKVLCQPYWCVKRHAFDVRHGSNANLGIGCDIAAAHNQDKLSSEI